MANIKGKQLTDSLSVTNVTGSNVSASGLIIGSSGSFGNVETDDNVTVNGELLVSQFIRHKGDVNTLINFTDNRIRFKAGDIGFLDLEKDSSTPYPFTINQGGNRINFRVMDRNTDLVLKTDSEAFNVGLYHAGNKKLETTSTGIDVSNINVSASGHITASGNISASGDITATNFNGIFIGALSSSAQIASNISGSFTAPSASFSTRVTTAESELGNTLLSGSAQIATDISGSFVAPSASFSTRVTTAESELGNTLLSGSAQISSDISGSFTAPSASFSTRVTLTEESASNLATDSGSFSTRITTTESELSNTILSSSAQISTDISGSFVAPSASFSTRVTTAETELGNTLISSSVQIASDISGSLSAAAIVGLGAGVISASAMVDHDSTTNFVANEHIDHSGVTITAGDGLTGGGTIASTRTLAVGQGTGVTINANDVAIGQDVATTANVTFASVTTTGNIEAEGDVIAQNYIVSSSVTHMTSSFRSGSTISGDTPADDTHQFTGSLSISGSSTDIFNTSTASLASIFVQNDGHISSSGGRIKGFDQIAATTFNGNVLGTSGSFLGVFGVGVAIPKVELEVIGSVSASASGSFLNANVKDNLEVGGKFTLPNITDVSASIASAVAGGDDMGNHTATQDLDMDGNDIFDVQHISGSGNISGSGGNILGYKSGSFAYVSSSNLESNLITSNDDLRLDSSLDIILDADGADIILKDGGTEFGRFKRDSSDFIIKSMGNNNDLVFRGRDDGSTITALTLDMSEGGNAQFLKNISGSQIEASGDVIAFGSSDKRLKDNIQPIENPLEKMDKIGGYTFDWNEKQDAYKGHDVGVIAQEIEEVLPELVTTRDTGYKAVKYEKIVPLLIESIKENTKKIKELEEEINQINKNCACLNK